MGAYCVTDITETGRGIAPAGLALRIALQGRQRSAEFNRQEQQALVTASFQFSAQAGQ